MLELFKCVEDIAGVQEEDIAGAQECSSDNPIAGVQEEEIAEAHEHSSDNATAHLQEAYPDDREPTQVGGDVELGSMGGCFPEEANENQRENPDWRY